MLTVPEYPVIDMEATGENIRRLRVERGISVRAIQAYLNLSDVQAIYQWQRGKKMPSLDHLCALATLFDVSVDDIIVTSIVQI